MFSAKESKPRVSIVDDDLLVRNALSRLCSSVGYDVATYESAEAFMESDQSIQSDVLVLDVHLPGRSGLELQSELQGAKRELPIVFVTAYEDEQARMDAIAGGAIDFLRKPLDADRLLHVIQEALDAEQ